MVSAIMKFNTLAWAKKLEKAGVPPQQAEAQIEIFSEVIGDNVCTKQDLLEVRKDLFLEIEKVRGSINAQIARWVLGVSAIQATVLITFIRSIH